MAAAMGGDVGGEAVNLDQFLISQVRAGAKVLVIRPDEVFPLANLVRRSVERREPNVQVEEVAYCIRKGDLKILGVPVRVDG